VTKEIMFIDQAKLAPNDIIRGDIESKTFDYNIDILKSSIEAQGILTPLLVSQSDGKYLIVDGNRRFAAGVRAGLKEFPCLVIKELKSDNFAKITEVGFSANELRQNLTPSQEIEALKKVCVEGNLTLEEISESTGKTINQLMNISQRAGLHEEIIVMMDEGKISRSTSDKIVALPKEEQIEVVETLKALSIPLTEENIRLYRGRPARIENMHISKKIVKKLKENIGLHAEELEKLKRHYRNLEKELASAHQLVQRIWRVPELHDYLKDNQPGVYKDFKRVLAVLGF